MSIYNIIPNGTKHIIFDFDGTIANTCSIWADINQKIIEKLNLKIEVKELDKLVKNLTQNQISEFVVKKFDLTQTPDQVTKVWYDCCCDTYKQCQFINSADQFIIQCYEQKIRMGIATNSPLCFVLNFFSTKNKIFGEIFNKTNIVSCDDDEVKACKPNTKVYEVCLNRISGSVNFENTVIFEDYIEAVKGCFTLSSQGAFVVAILSQDVNENELKIYQQNSNQQISDYRC